MSSTAALKTAASWKTYCTCKRKLRRTGNAGTIHEKMPFDLFLGWKIDEILWNSCSSLEKICENGGLHWDLTKKHGGFDGIHRLKFYEHLQVTMSVAIVSPKMWNNLKLFRTTKQIYLEVFGTLWKSVDFGTDQLPFPDAEDQQVITIRSYSTWLPHGSKYLLGKQFEYDFRG